MRKPIRLTEKRKKEFLEAIKALGGSSGNTSLRKKLGWDEELYERVRDSCGDKIESGPGYGGTVHLREARKGSRSIPARGNDCAFIAMPIDRSDPNLEDVLEAIRDAARRCKIDATRIDDDQSNERITDRILKAIESAQFVIVDLTKERPNVFYEAGYAQGIGKTPVYIAREGTTVHFDVKDYPIIMYRNMTGLKEDLITRLSSLHKKRRASRA
jgi:hypothetical protein